MLQMIVAHQLHLNRWPHLWEVPQQLLGGRDVYVRKQPEKLHGVRGCGGGCSLVCAAAACRLCLGF
jgi:hypothetical protein